MSLGEEYLNDYAYEIDEAVEEWERRSIEEEHIKEYERKQKELICIVRMAVSDATDVER